MIITIIIITAILKNNDENSYNKFKIMLLNYKNRNILTMILII
jgi:hypothetical protein